jgi:hypothetical protein
MTPPKTSAEPTSSRKKTRGMEDIYGEAKGPHRSKENNWGTLLRKEKLKFIKKQLKCDPRDDLEILEAAAAAAEEELKAEADPAGRIDM